MKFTQEYFKGEVLDFSWFACGSLIFEKKNNSKPMNNYKNILTKGKCL